jgi:cytochrome b561
MPVKSIAVHCRRCEADTPHLVETPNHVLHGVLTLFTIGFWVIPWIIVAAIGDSTPACSKCAARPKPPPTAAELASSRRGNYIVIGFVVVATVAAIVYGMFIE